MKHEVYALQKLGLVDLTLLYENFPYQEKGVGMAWLDIRPILDNGSGHEFDEERLLHFRKIGTGIYNPVMCVFDKPDQHTIRADLIDGWHRLKVLSEMGKKQVLSWMIPETVVKHFLSQPELYLGSDDLKRFLPVE
jgi:hypothetical protein